MSKNKIPTLRRRTGRKLAIRVRIPDECQAALGGKKEIFESLNESDWSKAKYLHALRLAEIRAQFDEIRRAR